MEVPGDPGYVEKKWHSNRINRNWVTIGCIPITDDKIKELYIYAVEAKNNGQVNIPVHIFPAKLTDEGLKILRE
jgi:hypothetical protein